MIRNRLTKAPATGVDLLHTAAILFPSVAYGCPLSSDIHSSLVAAANLMGAADRAEALRLADEATDMFTEFLGGRDQLSVWMAWHHNARAIARWMDEIADEWREILAAGAGADDERDQAPMALVPMLAEVA
jgi:hypothetical protein